MLTHLSVDRGIHSPAPWPVAPAGGAVALGSGPQALIVAPVQHKNCADWEIRATRHGLCLGPRPHDHTAPDAERLVHRSFAVMLDLDLIRREIADPHEQTALLVSLGRRETPVPAISHPAVDKNTAILATILAGINARADAPAELRITLLTYGDQGRPWCVPLAGPENGWSLAECPGSATARLLDTVAVLDPRCRFPRGKDAGQPALYELETQEDIEGLVSAHDRAIALRALNLLDQEPSVEGLRPAHANLLLRAARGSADDPLRVHSDGRILTALKGAEGPDFPPWLAHDLVRGGHLRVACNTLLPTNMGTATASMIEQRTMARRTHALIRAWRGTSAASYATGHPLPSQARDAAIPVISP